MTKLNARHFAFLIIAIAGIGLKTYSSIFIRISGRDVWLCTLIAGLIFIAFFLFIIYVSKKIDVFKIEEVFTKALSKPVGYFFIGLFCIGIFLISIEATSVQSSSLHTNIFIETPIWYCLVFFIVPAAYVSSRKLKTLIPLTLITVTVVIITDLLLMVASVQYTNTTYLLPMFFNGFSREIVFSIIMIIGSFSAVIITLPFLRYIRDTENLIKNSAISISFNVITSVIVMVFLITFFGPLRAGNIYYPEFVQSQRIQIGTFLECGDILFLIRTNWMLSLKYIFAFNAIFVLLGNKIKNKNIFALIYGLIVFGVSYYVSLNQFYLFSLLRYLQFLFFILFFLIPLIIYFIFFIKEKIAMKKKI